MGNLENMAKDLLPLWPIALTTVVLCGSLAYMVLQDNYSKRNNADTTDDYRLKLK